MPPPLKLDPATTAVVTVEMQRGIVGDLTKPNELTARVAEKSVVEHIVAISESARSAGARVIHCTTGFRADRAGTFITTPLVRFATKQPDFLLQGSDSAELLHELKRQPEDIEAFRLHGVSPLGGTGLDAMLRSLGVQRLVVTGVAVNLAVLGLAIEAANFGYEVIVVDDAVAGFPAEFEAEVLARTIGLVARRVSTAEVVSSWASALDH